MAKTQAFLANVMDAFVYAGDELLFTSKALTDSSISIGITAEEVRGGKGNKLIGRFFHDSTFSLELQDALFNLDYIAKNVGTQITPATGALYEEQVVAAGGALSVSGVPSDFLGMGNLGWYSLPGEDEWTKFSFNGNASADATVIDGETYCVKYINDLACEQVIVPSEFVPDEVTVVLKGDLYKASKGNDVTTSSIIGHVEVTVPRFQLNGSMDISLNSSGASQIPFAGNALVTMDASAGCEGGGYYAIIKQYSESGNWYDSLIAIAVEGSDVITAEAGSTKALKAYGVFANGSSKLLSDAQVSYEVSPTSIGSVTGGVFTAGSAGTGTITVTVAGSPNPKPSVSAEVGVTVTD